MSKNWMNILETLIYATGAADSTLATFLGVAASDGNRIHDKFALANQDRGGDEDQVPADFHYPRVTFRVEIRDYSEEMNYVKNVTIHFDVWSKADTKEEVNDIAGRLEALFAPGASSVDVNLGELVHEFHHDDREPDTKIRHTSDRYSGTAVELT